VRARSRFHIYELTCILLATATGTRAQTSQAATADVALGFQITTSHTGAIKSTGLKPPLTVKWSLNLPGVASYPIIAQGKVFVIGGGSPSTLYGLDAQTGQIVWSQPVPAGFGAWIGAAYENGALFVVPTSNPMFGSGAMFAFSAQDGHQIWSANLPGQYSFSSAPTARNGIVYTSGAGSGGTVYAVQESNGSVLWTAPVVNGDSSAPAVTPNGVFVSYVCPQTYGFNPTSGQLLWHYSGACEGGGGESAAVYQGLVYVRDLYNYATDGITISATNGTLVGGFNSQYSPAFWGTTAVYTEPDTLTGVDLSTGTTVWTAVAPAGESYSCAPIIVNGVVYAGTSAGNLHGYAVGSGKKLFSIGLGPAISCGEYFAAPLAGMSARNGLLVVPAGSEVVALQ
jgi:outer membrane protein assembly factor BamB